MQSELETAKRDAEQAKAHAGELARSFASLNSELEKANAERNELQTKLDRATSEAELAQSQLKDKQPYLEQMQSELETAKQDAEQAKAQATEFASLFASLNAEVEKSNAQLASKTNGSGDLQTSDSAQQPAKTSERTSSLRPSMWTPLTLPLSPLLTLESVTRLWLKAVSPKR